MGPKKGKSLPAKDPVLEGAPKKKLKVENDYTTYQDIATWLRIDSANAVHRTKSGHPTSCSSIADIMSALFFHPEGLKFHSDNTKHFLNDRFVLSKGHAAPILYAALYRSGVITQDQLMSLRIKGSIIEGHPTPKIPFVDVATGSLGQGLSVAAGMAYSSKYFDKIDNFIYCVCGDGEVAQGSIWQAANFAGYYNLNNLVVIVDVNRLGQSQQTMFQHNMKQYESKFAAFDWSTYVIDGHNFDEIIKAFIKIRKETKKPSAILAKTFKGKYFGELIENKLDWHGKDLGNELQNVVAHLKSSIKSQKIDFTTYKPEGDEPPLNNSQIVVNPVYPQGSKISTRKAYGNGLLRARQSSDRIVGLDGDTKNSTFAITLKDKYPDSFVQCFIAQQNLVGVATGLGCRRKIPFCSTFACFFSRANDQIRIAGISHSNLKMVGSHSGVSIGEDGPSQMALEDLAFFRALPEAIVLVPSDGYSVEKAVEIAANKVGPAFIRTSRPQVPLLYNQHTKFQLGKLHTIKESENDNVALVSYGVTLHESVKAYSLLKQEGINVRVIDLFSLKPLDVEGLRNAASKCSGRVIVVEEHYPEGGAGDAVCSATVGVLKEYDHLCVRKVPGSATPTEQLQIHGIDVNGIVKSVKKMLNKQ